MFPDYAAFFAEFFWLELFRSIKFVARLHTVQTRPINILVPDFFAMKLILAKTYIN